MPEHFLKYTTLCGVLQNAGGVMRNPAPCTANTSAVAGPITAVFPKTGLNGRTGRAAQPALPQARVFSPFSFLDTSLAGKINSGHVSRPCLSAPNLFGLVYPFQSLCRTVLFSLKGNTSFLFFYFSCSLSPPISSFHGLYLFSLV